MEIIHISQTTMKKVKMDINHFHYKLGHPHSHRLKLTAKAMNITLTGELDKLLACLKAKDNKKNINKFDTKRSVIRGERLGLDIS